MSYLYKFATLKIILIKLCPEPSFFSDAGRPRRARRRILSRILLEQTLYFSFLGKSLTIIRRAYRFDPKRVNLYPFSVFLMGLNKTEINLRRLLAAAPRQQNQAKLIHYVTTLRELLEQIGVETTAGVSSVTKAKLNDYSEKIEAIAAKLAAPIPQETEEIEEIKQVENTPRADKIANYMTSSEGLRRRAITQTEVGGSIQETEKSFGEPIRLDASTQAHIEKHRKLQDDLTDEMVGLAHQLKESSLMMNQSLQDTEKILDSTERAVEHSLASTGHANVRAVEVYSETSKTTCFTWLLLFGMTCIFVMVVLLIRVT